MQVLKVQNNKNNYSPTFAASKIKVYTYFSEKMPREIVFKRHGDVSRRFSLPLQKLAQEIALTKDLKFINEGKFTELIEKVENIIGEKLPIKQGDQLCFNCGPSGFWLDNRAPLKNSAIVEFSFDSYDARRGL